MPINELKSLDTSGVSLVRQGANRRRIAFTKSEEPTMAVDLKSAELLGGVLKSAFEGEAQTRELVLKAHPGIGEKEADAIVGALRLLKGFQDSAAVKATACALEALAKGEVPEQFKKAPAKKEAEEDCGDEEEMELKKGLPAEVAKSLDGLPKEQRPAMAALLKSVRASEAAAAKARIEKAEASAAEAKAQAEKTQAILKAEQDSRRSVEFIAKAEKHFSHVPGKAADLGAILKELDDVKPALRERVEVFLKAAEEGLAQSSLFKEVGRSGSGSGGAAEDPMAKIAKGAEEKAKAEATA